MAFDEKPLPKPKSGLKIDNKQSAVQQPSKLSPSEFSDRADEAFSNLEDQKTRGWTLAVKYKELIVDQTLQINKSPIVSNLENEILDKLVLLATEINEDENQLEGLGSTTLCMLLMKCMLVQRDRINELAFEVEKLKKSKNITPEKV